MFTDHKFFKELNVFSKVVVSDRDRPLRIKCLMNGNGAKSGVFFTVYETQKVYSIDDIVEIDNK